MGEREERCTELQRAAVLLLTWFEENRRELPFRKDRDPYLIYVSEIMLQQTRISAVIPYYLHFVERYPDLNALALADDAELMKLWEGLGYYSRVRNMKRTAQICCERYGGRLPETYGEAVALPGIGSYTAGAILSLAFDQKVPLVDGNVLRVLSRFFGDRSDIGDPKTKRAAEELLGSFLERADVSPSAFNESLMELGETVCIPNGEPLCGQCPLEGSCEARRLGLTGELPVKAPKKRRKVTDLTVFLLYAGERIGLLKRPETGLLAGLFGLPVKEGALAENEAAKVLKEQRFAVKTLTEYPSAVHIFTHAEWHMTAFRADLSAVPESFGESRLIFVSEQELREKYALPGAFRKWELFPDPEES